MKSTIGRNWLMTLCLCFILAGISTAQPPNTPPTSSSRGSVLQDHTSPALSAFLRAAKPVELEPSDDELQRLLKARYNEAVKGMTAWISHGMLVANVNARFIATPLARQVVDSGMELCDTPKEKVDLLAHYVELMIENEEVEKAKQDAGKGNAREFHRARYLRLDAEIELLRAKREADEANGE